MHLAFLSTNYYPRMVGGAEHSLQHHAEFLVRLGARVSVLSLHEKDKVERFTHNGVECHAYPVPNLRQCMDHHDRAPALARAAWHVLDVYNPVAGRLLRRELEAIKPDLLQTENLPGWSCSAWAAARLAGVPHVQMVHDFQMSCPPATRFRDGKNCEKSCFSCAAFSAVARRQSRHVRHVVANSNYTRDVHRQLGYFTHAETFDVIYGAVPPPPSLKRMSRDPGPIRVGYLGRLHPTKGVRVLVDSFVRVDRPDLALRIAGTGPKEFETELRAVAHGHDVGFLGHTPAAAFLDSIDVLVVPSLWHEPMGRVVIEAATHGVPVIAAKRGGIPELFTEGRTGWAFDPAAPAELDERLRALSLTELWQMREACRRAAEDFTPDAIARKWLQVYGHILRHTATSPINLPAPAPIVGTPSHSPVG